jgi:hypothetical protein
MEGRGGIATECLDMAPEVLHKQETGNEKLRS